MSNARITLDPRITQAHLRHLFDYDPDTGALIWKNPTSRMLKRGDPAGFINRYGSSVVKIFSRPYPTDRIIWMLETGKWSDGVSHANNDASDLRWCNLSEGRIYLPPKTPLDQELANRLFHYDPTLGHVTRKLLIHRKDKFSTPVGCLNGDGYLVTRVATKLVRIHRLIFLMLTGEFPEHDVDHINGNRADNRWDNLRLVTRSGNTKNARMNSNNTSGVCGVRWNTVSHKWRAAIASEGVAYNLGQFDTKEEAIAARKAANIKYNFHPNHGLPQHEREKYAPETN